MNFCFRGVAFFHGPWYVTPSEIAHAPNRLFYKQEVFLSSIEDTNPLLSVVSKCCVLDCNDYVTCKSNEPVLRPDDLFNETLFRQVAQPSSSRATRTFASRCTKNLDVRSRNWPAMASRSTRTVPVSSKTKFTSSGDPSSRRG